jgi:GTPase SAR1 family protein
LADEFGLRFLETSAKANEGVEEAFFTLARSVFYFFELSCADIQSEISRPA